MIVSGLGYDPEVGKWNKGRNVRIRQIEYGRNTRLVPIFNRLSTIERHSRSRLSLTHGTPERIIGYESACISA